MSVPVVTKIMFSVTFPLRKHPVHVPPRKLHSLLKRQLSDSDVIDTIDHLFGCQHCFEQYRFIRTSYQASV